MSNVFSLGVVQRDVQLQFTVAREILELALEVRQRAALEPDPAVRAEFERIAERLAALSDKLAGNAKNTGQEVVRFVVGSASAT